MMGIKEEDRWDEHWALCVSGEALNPIPEIIIARYVD